MNTAENETVTKKTQQSKYPYEKIDLKWQRPDIDREILKQCSQPSDLQGWFHCLGILAILAASGSMAYYFYLNQQWFLMVLALYIHGGLVAFNPQFHELSHGHIFKTPWLNQLFRRVFEIIHWHSSIAEYKMSHSLHHRYTTHRKAEGEVVLPMPRTWENVLSEMLKVVNVNGFIHAVYDRIYDLCVPYLKNPRKSLWMRYVYENASTQQRRDDYWTKFGQLIFHVVFAAIAIATGHWFLIVIVTLPMFYGAKWYHLLVHDTMHSGRQPETDDFRLCCRSVKLDPFTSFLYWHMQWHTEHHTFPAVPPYNLKKLHKMTRDHWQEPMSLIAAWNEMNEAAKQELKLNE